ncbi:hypothetical protein Tcan_00599, partial [Toxocara canis]
WGFSIAKLKSGTGTGFQLYYLGSRGGNASSLLLEGRFDQLEGYCEPYRSSFSCNQRDSGSIVIILTVKRGLTRVSAATAVQHVPGGWLEVLSSSPDRRRVCLTANVVHYGAVIT